LAAYNLSDVSAYEKDWRIEEGDFRHSAAFENSEDETDFRACENLETAHQEDFGSGPAFVVLGAG
jgi:hypothetical protein